MTKCGWNYGTMGMHPCQLGQCIGADECDQKPKCDHLDYAYIDNPDSPAVGDGYIGVEFNYCPNCGEKL